MFPKIATYIQFREEEHSLPVDAGKCRLPLGVRDDDTHQYGGYLPNIVGCITPGADIGALGPRSLALPALDNVPLWGPTRRSHEHGDVGGLNNHEDTRSDGQDRIQARECVQGSVGWVGEASPREAKGAIEIDGEDHQALAKAGVVGTSRDQDAADGLESSCDRIEV